jgi:predicted ATPase/DNA-binding CsgD family transcriptional regulator
MTYHIPVAHNGASELEPISQYILPRPLTPLVGREQEVAKVEALLQRPEVHLVSIVGTVGVGKTRLALQVATELLVSFVDGVFFIALAPLRDPELVLPTVAQTLGLRARENESFLDLLEAFLCGKHCLLLLDNCEQVVSAVPLLVELLQVCPFVKMLVTSRAVLHVRGEYVFLVRPLALPDLTHRQDRISFSQVAAVQCFLHRVQAVKPEFQLTDCIAHIIAEICIRLDGLPLALELAATYLKLLSPQQLLMRLEHRLQLLTAGAADLPERQRTLRNALQWSYELLCEGEQRLFRRLAVFVGGCTLESVEGMYSMLAEDGNQILNNVRALLDKQLLYQQHEGESGSRLLMLETIREYGLECLGAETVATRCAHADYYLAQAEQRASKEFRQEQELLWLAQEHDNLRAALNWFLEQNARDKALRLGIALYEGSVASVRSQLGEEAFAKAWARGQKMTLEHILVAEDEGTCLLPLKAQSLRRPHLPCSPEGLTPRELEVLRLLAQGLKSTQIAEQLIIGVVTVNFHVRSIYSKLAVRSRAAATRYAIEHHLV